jgi:nitroimidazol reductase NimA-like FMN-containing flavoprotein (pyridoxamine 5'-phosphate oxidase superfamily)
MANTLYTDHQNAKEVIDKCDVCYLGMIDPDNKPYVLPFNFGYENETIYLHSAPMGKKIDILKTNPDVCVSFSTDHKLFHRHETVACSYGMRYRSVLAFGKVEFIEDFDEKVNVLNIIMKKYAGQEFSYNAPAVNNVSVYKVVIEKIETKISGY